MITHLQIKNYALIEHLEMAPAADLSTITGETGAGKSIMLGAIGLLLGNRADVTALLDPDQKCVVEGTFSIKALNLKSLFEELEADYDDETILRREINPNGKSRAFINDMPVTLDIMKRLGSRLVDIHSQSDTSLLSNSLYQLNVVDFFAGNEGLHTKYTDAFRQMSLQQKTVKALQDELAQLQKESDYNNFLFDELEKANLKNGEQEQLEEEQEIITHAEEIKRNLLESANLLYEDEVNIVNLLQQVERNLQQAGRYDHKVADLQQRISSALIELRDVADEVSSEEQKVEYEHTRAEEISERLSMIYALQKKHQVSSIDELLKIWEQLSRSVTRTDEIEDELKLAQKALNEATTLVTALSDQLSEARKKCFAPLKKELEALLAALGMPNATFDIRQERIAPTKSGGDEIQFFFSANKGIAPAELRKVASGGEFSRLMFAIKYILAQKTHLPTIIFDEIDTGISGEIAIKMATMMRLMSQRHQVVAITHLPQIAASGSTHFFVYKDDQAAKAVSKIKALTEHDRILELAKMVGGDSPSEAAMENARELLRR